MCARGGHRLGGASQRASATATLSCEAVSGSAATSWLRKYCTPRRVFRGTLPHSAPCPAPPAGPFGTERGGHCQGIAEAATGILAIGSHYFFGPWGVAAWPCVPVGPARPFPTPSGLQPCPTLRGLVVSWALSAECRAPSPYPLARRSSGNGFNGLKKGIRKSCAQLRCVAALRAGRSAERVAGPAWPSLAHRTGEPSLRPGGRGSDWGRCLRAAAHLRGTGASATLISSAWAGSWQSDLYSIGSKQTGRRRVLACCRWLPLADASRNLAKREAVRSVAERRGLISPPGARPARPADPWQLACGARLRDAEEPRALDMDWVP